MKTSFPIQFLSIENNMKNGENGVFWWKKKNEPNISIDRGNRISRSFETIVKNFNKSKELHSGKTIVAQFM